jgi:predicted small metal-binding protein
MLFPVFLKILDLILMVGPENLCIGDGLGNNIEEMYYYFEFLNKFEVPNSNQKNPENWMLDYSNWKKNKENNMKFLIQKIEMHAKYTHKIMNKIEKDWIDKFHISNVVKLQEFNDLQTQLLNFEISEGYLLK